MDGALTTGQWVPALAMRCYRPSWHRSSTSSATRLSSRSLVHRVWPRPALPQARAQTLRSLGRTGQRALMIEAAEAEGELKPGGTIVEATAGNTGLGLALVGGRKGYRTLLVVARQDGAGKGTARARPWVPRSSRRAPTSARAIPITIRTLPRRSRAARPGRFSSTSSPIRPTLRA